MIWKVMRSLDYHSILFLDRVINIDGAFATFGVEIMICRINQPPGFIRTSAVTQVRGQCIGYHELIMHSIAFYRHESTLHERPSNASSPPTCWLCMRQSHYLRKKKKKKKTKGKRGLHTHSRKIMRWSPAGERFTRKLRKSSCQLLTGRRSINISHSASIYLHTAFVSNLCVV